MTGTCYYYYYYDDENVPEVRRGQMRIDGLLQFGQVPEEVLSGLRVSEGPVQDSGGEGGTLERTQGGGGIPQVWEVPVREGGRGIHEERHPRVGIAYALQGMQQGDQGRGQDEGRREGGPTSDGGGQGQGGSVDVVETTGDRAWQVGPCKMLQVPRMEGDRPQLLKRGVEDGVHVLWVL